MTKKLSTKRVAKHGPDKENPEWTKADFTRAVPFSSLPERLQQALMTRKRGEQKVETSTSTRFRG
jgi:hypothetical protein